MGRKLRNAYNTKSFKYYTLGYVHLHDNHGESDEHLGLGQGTIPVSEVCQALQHYAPTAIWGIETALPHMESSVHWLEEHDFLEPS